jgi:hypothetical membrane protein
MTAGDVAVVRHPSDRLLLAGALAGPVFVVSAVAQMVSRDGFDITRHAISQLANGDLGWIQIATFILAGLGGLALAAGVRSTLTEGIGRRALPLLVAVFGAGLIIAGLFTTDPENGFPAGVPDGPAARMSWHGVVHATAAAIAFTALGLAVAVLSVRCARRGAPLPAALNAAAALVLMLPVSREHMSIQIAVTGLVAFGWTTALALWLRRSARPTYR